MLVISESLTGNKVDNGTSYGMLRYETGTRLLPVSTSNNQTFRHISPLLANHPLFTRLPNEHEETTQLMHNSSFLVHWQQVATLNNSLNSPELVVPARMKTGPSSLLVMNEASTFEHSSAPIPESHLPIASIGCFYSCILVQCWSYRDSIQCDPQS